MCAMRANRTLSATFFALFFMPLVVHAQAPSPSRPLGRGIADIQARIQRNKQLTDELQEAVAGHVQSIGELIYAAYGQNQDPGRLLIELKKAYDDVHNAVQN